jgi:hypothetical protein
VTNNQTDGFQGAGQQYGYGGNTNVIGNFDDPYLNVQPTGGGSTGGGDFSSGGALYGEI